jgi:hypothetical protein
MAQSLANRAQQNRQDVIGNELVEARRPETRETKSKVQEMQERRVREARGKRGEEARQAGVER